MDGGGTCPAGEKSGRQYHSPVRRQKADATRRRILDAADRLFVERGYAGTAIADIAGAACVSGPTVYAIFRSKRGILSELLDRSACLPEVERLLRTLDTLADPQAGLRVSAKATRLICEAETVPDLMQLAGTGGIDADLLALLISRDNRRKERQRPFVAALYEAGHLRPDLSRDRALDIMWTLTSRPVYFLLRRRCGWSGQEYEDWLYAMLCAALLPCAAGPGEAPDCRGGRCPAAPDATAAALLRKPVDNKAE